MAPRTCLALLLGALIISPSAAQVELPAWDQFHYNAAHTGFNPVERVLTRANVRKLRKAWAVKTGGAIEGSVAVARNLVFVGSDNNVLHAYHLDGREAWSQRLQGDARFVASPAVAGDTVYGYTSASVVTALDTADGHLRWSRSLSDVVGVFPGSPTTTAGLVYAVPYELVALDSAGSVRWTRPNVGCFLCSPAVRSGVLFIGGGPAVGRRLLAHDASTGAARWSFRPQAGRSFAWSGSPAAAGGRVFQAAYVQRGGTKAYSLYALRASSGKRLWKVSVGRSDLLNSSAPAVA
jgi:outer membrane protein assembly factor BamB